MTPSGAGDASCRPRGTRRPESVPEAPEPLPGHLTASGPYLRQNPKANLHGGRRNVTHGCVVLATDGTAKRFYDEVVPGDVIKVVGSRDTVTAGHGYGDWNLNWDQWRETSALD
nr:L,D-transpeptidase [Streptomyces sp. M41(2017)]